MGYPELPYRNCDHMSHGHGDPLASLCIRVIIAFIVLLLTAGITALFIWVGLGFEPKCTLRHLQIPAIIANSSTTPSNTVYFSLKLHNRNENTSIYYDALNFTVSYGGLKRKSSLVNVGNTSLIGFHQHGDEKARVYGSFESGEGGWRKEAAEEVRVGGKAGFRVDLKTDIRYKILLWKTKRHRVAVGADVSVGKDGNLVLKKGIFRRKGVRLTSSAGVLPGKDRCGRLLAAVLVALVVYLSCVW